MILDSHASMFLHYLNVESHISLRHHLQKLDFVWQQSADWIECNRRTSWFRCFWISSTPWHDVSDRVHDVSCSEGIRVPKQSWTDTNIEVCPRILCREKKIDKVIAYDYEPCTTLQHTFALWLTSSLVVFLCVQRRTEKLADNLWRLFSVCYVPVDYLCTCRLEIISKLQKRIKEVI